MARPPDEIGGHPRKVDRPHKTAEAFTDAGQAIAAVKERLNAEPSGRWQYHDKNGDVVGYVLRFDPPGKDKTFRPISRHGGHWFIGAMEAPRPLYRLPKLQSAKHILVVEGEEAADALRAIGIKATTCPGGSNGVSNTDVAPLAGATVSILPDNDTPGERYAQTLALRLEKLKPRPEVGIVRLPNLPEKGDAADFVPTRRKAGRTDDEICAEIEELCGQAEPMGPTERLVVTRMDQVESQVVEWIWPGRIPAGKLSMIVGDPSAGKSMLVVDVAARISNGAAWPDAPTEPGIVGDVLLLNDEDGLADTIRPRLDAASAKALRIHHIGANRRRTDSGAIIDQPVRLDADLQLLEEELAKIDNPRLIVVDPINAYMAGVDAHKDVDIRSLLMPLAQLAERTGVAILAICHLRKSAGKAIHSVLGSIGYVGVARVVWLVATDRDEPERRLFLPVKNNLAQLGRGLAYRIVAPHGAPHIEWEPAPIEARADDYTGGDDARRDRTARNDACEWLIDVLSDGPVASKEIEVRAGRTESRGGPYYEQKKISEYARSAPLGAGHGYHRSPTLTQQHLKPNRRRLAKTIKIAKSATIQKLAILATLPRPTEPTRPRSDMGRPPGAVLDVA